MAVTSKRVIGISFSGDVDAPSLAYPAATNLVSPGMIDVRTLASGANTINVPTGATAVTIIPPAGNAVTLALKGVSGDTGVPLNLTDPTSIALPTTATTFVLTAGASLVGVRLIWS